MKVSIGLAAKEVGVTVVTLRAWEKAGEDYGDCDENSAPAQSCS